MRFSIPPDVLRRLRGRTATRAKDEVETAEDGFLLHPGMGPALYLTSDGRVLKDNRDWDESCAIEEGTDDDAVAALVIGAENLDLHDLIDLLPPPPANSRPCNCCAGSHWYAFKDYFGRPARIVCPECRGRGYISSHNPGGA
jgi:hypothetical protein